MPTEGRGERTRRTMIDSAERLVAERGLTALSLREVAAAAGQRNHSAVQYHFGSRDKLVEAIFEARMGPIDARRNQGLVDLDDAGLGTDTLCLVDVMVRPLAEYVLVEPPGWYGRFLAEISRNAPNCSAPTVPSSTRSSASLCGSSTSWSTCRPPFGASGCARSYGRRFRCWPTTRHRHRRVRRSAG